MDVKLKSRVFGVVLLIAVIVVFALPPRYNHTPSRSGEVWISPLTLIFEELMESVAHKPSAHISIYDDLLRDISLTVGNDWRLMAAIAYVESRFIYDARSNTGAIGLMQIMPRTGRHYGCDQVQLLDPKTNIMVANLLYNDIDRMLRAPASVSERDLMSLILASYNGGIGHLFDAQRLTRLVEGDPFCWRDVAPHLLSLRDSVGYNNPVVQHGKFATARSTVRYVKDVMKKYDEYVARTHLERLHLYPYAIRDDELDIDDM